VPVFHFAAARLILPPLCDVCGSKKRPFSTVPCLDRPGIPSHCRFFHDDYANSGPIPPHRRRFWKMMNFFSSNVFDVVLYASSSLLMSTTLNRR